MIKLSSGISRELKGHFVLDENGLREIADTLFETAKGLPYPCSIVFHVRREDDRFYETTQVKDVLTDANTPGAQITLLRIELRNADPNKVAAPWERDWIAAVQFGGNEDKLNIDVASEDKVQALLLADAVEPQITKTLTAKKIPSWILIPSYSALAFLLYTLTKTTLIRNPDIIGLFQLAIWGSALILSLSTLGVRSAMISSWAGPRSSFHWGKQASSYNQFESNRQNILWVVIVGFAVSIMATIYTNSVFPQAPEPRPNTTSNSAPKASSAETRSH